jgi:hypothetical protein
MQPIRIHLVRRLYTQSILQSFVLITEEMRFSAVKFPMFPYESQFVLTIVLRLQCSSDGRRDHGS